MLSQRKHIEIRQDMTETELVNSMLGLVRRMAGHMAHSLPSHIRRDDLSSAGMLGLVEAVRRFDPTRADSYVGYATLRIRGAMLDELRRGDIMSQEARTQSRRLSKISQSLETELGHAPSEDELAKALGMSAEKYRKELGHLGAVHTVSFEAQDELQPFTDTGAENPSDAAERGEERAELARAISTLPEREQLIVSLYYEQDLTFQEIGAMLDLTAARVCQLHTACMTKLRRSLEA